MTIGLKLKVSVDLTLSPTLDRCLNLFGNENHVDVKTQCLLDVEKTLNLA